MKTIALVSLALHNAVGESPECKSPKANPWCYGLGEYAVGTEVTHTKCPQLNLRDYHDPATGAPTKVIARKCINAAGQPSEGQDCFSIKTAIWEPKSLTGIGVNGYWTDFQTTADKQLYGWTDGVLPDAKPLPNDPNITRISIGQAVLCRDKTITKPGVAPAGTYPANVTVSCVAAANPGGCWMQGQIVGQSYDKDTWVCELDDSTREIIPHTTQDDIRPLCFAKVGDYEHAEAMGMKGHDLNWRAKFGASPNACDCHDPKCPTCCPYCRIAVTEAGYKCPTDVGLGDDVLQYDVTTTHLYTPASVDGIFFTDPSLSKLSVQVNGVTVAPQWGPQPGGASYLMKRLPASGIDNNAFGRYVLCPSAPGAKTYAGGEIFNTPLQTADKTFHVYTCDNENLNATKALKCQPSDMLELCYPKSL